MAPEESRCHSLFCRVRKNGEKWAVSKETMKKEDFSSNRTGLANRPIAVAYFLAQRPDKIQIQIDRSFQYPDSTALRNPSEPEGKEHS
jgi:hypothetical protein